MPFTEIRQFEAEHGVGIRADDDYWWLCPSGARYANQPGGNTLVPPPREPRELAEAKLRYHHVAVDGAVARFDAAKKRLAGRAWHALETGHKRWQTGPKEIAELRQLKAAVEQAGAALEKAEAAVAALGTAQQATKPDKEREARRAAGRRALAEIETITL